MANYNSKIIEKLDNKLSDLINDHFTTNKAIDEAYLAEGVTNPSAYAYGKLISSLLELNRLLAEARVYSESEDK